MNDEMTTDEIEAALARAEAATPEPWTVRTEQETGEWGSVLSTWIDAVEARVGDIVRWEDDYGNPHMPADAAFIAAARTDVPALGNALLASRKREATMRVACEVVLRDLDMLNRLTAGHPDSAAILCLDSLRVNLVASLAEKEPAP